MAGDGELTAASIPSKAHPCADASRIPESFLCERQQSRAGVRHASKEEDGTGTDVADQEEERSVRAELIHLDDGAGLDDHPRGRCRLGALLVDLDERLVEDLRKVQ